MRRILVSLGLGGLAAMVGACGGVSGPPQPRLIPGGGVGDGHVDGHLFVHVTDEDTDAVISNARVRVGAADDLEPCEEVTGSTGLVRFEPANCPSLTGPVTVTVTATGYAPSTWIGVDGTNLTINLRAISAPAAGRATVSGTIAGWDDLPAPATGHQTLAIVGASQTRELGGRDNEIDQGKRTIDVTFEGQTIPIDIDANLCVKNALVSDCNWRLTTRTGAQAHYAMIVDHDTNGTDDTDADDTFTVIGWALRRNVSFGQNEVASGELLERIADADMQPLTASFASPPSGMDFIWAYPMLDLGAEGRLPIVLPALTQTSLMTRIPRFAGSLSGARYDLLASAVDAQDQPQPATITWLRDVDVSQTVAVTAWMPPPTAIVMSAGTFSFTPVAGATIHGAEIQTMDGQRRWSITIFDGRASFTLPGVTPDPLPIGTLRLQVSALKLPGANLGDIAFETASEILTDLSSDEITYTR